MDETDRFLKDRLSYVFGEENDFDQLFGGVSTLATASNGEWVITNFLNALKPELQAGAESYWKNKKQAAVEQANRNRAQRRAGK